jgi:hypothetical protein
VQFLGGCSEAQVTRRCDEGAQRIEWWEAFGRLGFRVNFSILVEKKRSIAAPQLFNHRPVSIN